MTKAEMRKTVQKIHSDILNALPTDCTDTEIMYIYQKVAHMLLTETTAWAYSDYEEENAE